MHADSNAVLNEPTTREIRFNQAGLRHTADIELWLLSRLWASGPVTIPVYCVRCETEAKAPRLAFWLAGDFGLAYAQSAEKWFRESGMERVGELWVMPGTKIPAGMTKAPGVTPSYYVHHDPSHERAENIDDDFPMEVWRASGISDRAVFLAVWTALITSLPKWLVAKQRPVDLGFFRIVAVPLRAAWKVHVLSKFSALGQQLKSRGFSAVSDLICNTAMAEVVDGEKGHTFGWNLEIIPQSRWTRYTNRVEAKRLEAYPGETYLGQWGAILYKLKDEIVACLQNADAKARLPAGAVVRDGPADCKRLAPRTLFNARGPAVKDRVDLPIVLTGAERSVASDPDEAVAVTTPSSLQSMSFVRATTEDVRHTWDPLHGRRRGK